MPKFSINRRQFLGASALGAYSLLHTQASGAEGVDVQIGLTPSNTHPGQKAVLSVADPSRIRLLQLTDIHFFCKTARPELDKQTLEDVPRLIEKTQPDILLVSGDLWHDNPLGKGKGFMEFALDKVSSWGVPWIFTWGNHDKLDDYAAGHDALHNAKHSLYRGGPGGGNYIVTLQDQAGADLWDLVCLNSMGRGLLAPQRDWLKALPGQEFRPAAKNAFAVVHIPVAQYEQAWAAPECGGVRLEGVSSWDEDGSALPLIKALGTVRAYFCGHDHVNDYRATVDGIELVYGRATGSGGYGGDEVPKGAKIITANAQSGQYTMETVYPDGSTWQTEPGKKIDQYENTPWAKSPA
ncbi:MAG: metallophosphoesterase [Candidatus Hydrogenedentes bacterium]|nr:metallophosphoesterase [Candidatus Hydrogenedentota bacterium]